MRDGTWPAYVKEKKARQAMVGTHGGEPFNDYQDVLYVGEVDIGTPPQKFNLVLDTGSSNVWVVDRTCTSQACSGKNKFTSSSSSSYVRNGQSFSIQYGTGSCNGFLGQDKLCFGASGLCYSQQVFGQATSLAAFFTGQPMDGIAGLAWPSIAVDHVVPPIQNLLSSLDMPIFSVWMTEAATGQVGGMITYGAYDNMNCNMTSSGMGVNWAPLTSQTYWQYKMTGVRAGSYSRTYNYQVISDTGTSLLASPLTEFNMIGKALGGMYDSQNDIYLISCSAMPGPITLTINGMNYAITYKNYIINDSGTCYIGLQSFSGGGISWILGDVFIRQYCNVFDVGNKRVGFSMAKH